MNTEPTPTALTVAPVSRALALQDWELAFRLMDKLVGWELAGRWLVEELELAGAIDPKDVRDRRALDGRGPQPHL